MSAIVNGVDDGLLAGHAVGKAKLIKIAELYASFRREKYRVQAAESIISKSSYETGLAGNLSIRAKTYCLNPRTADHGVNEGLTAQALHGPPPTPTPAPRLAVIRPEIEAALKRVGPAPFEAGSKGLRDEDESSIELLDLIDGEPPDSPTQHTHVPSEEDEPDAIDFQVAE